MDELPGQEVRLARELATLRAELAQLGRDAPELQARIAVLARSLADLRADLSRFRAAQAAPERSDQTDEDSELEDCWTVRRSDPTD